MLKAALFLPFQGRGGRKIVTALARWDDRREE
jgi:hypothetical protein